MNVARLTFGQKLNLSSLFNVYMIFTVQIIPEESTNTLKNYKYTYFQYIYILVLLVVN